MKAVVCKTLDGPASLVVEDLAEPKAASGEVIVRVTAVGLNFADTLMTRGKYQFKPIVPFSPGAEIAGILETSTPNLVAGTRVMAYVNWGGAREKIAIDERALTPIPDAVADTVAAGLSVTYGTAMHGLQDRARLAASHTVVVTGAAGGAGQAAIEIAKLLGARVIAVASSEDKLRIATASGADEAVIFPGVDLKAAVRALTDGRGADVVYDCIGGEASEPLIRALAWQGRFLVVGFASGDIPKVPLNLLLLKGADVSGVFWGEAIRRDPISHAVNMRQLLDWVAQGRLKPRLHGTFPLEQAREALAILERREALGKIVLTL